MLPIYQIKAEFNRQLSTKTKQPIIVSANTGTGKSTHLPLWCAEFGKVLVIEPRRIACTSLAEHVAEQSGTQLGDKVGYAIRFEVIANENTEITFVTPGVALRWYNEGLLDKYHTIMLDEFHERRWDTDLILSMLLQVKSHQVIITSATLNSEQLVSYCNGIHLHAEGKVFPVKEHYLAASMRDMPSKESLTERVLFAVEQAFELGQQDVLVFLPGKGEIQRCASLLKTKLCDQFDIISLHGSSPIQVQQKALNQGDNRRCILATNVAETSLTIPGVDIVIDSGLERRTHIRNGQSVLDLCSIANDSKLQRRGRAGRLKTGHFIALYGQHAPLESCTPPEIQRENLTEMYLAASCNQQRLTELTFLNPISSQAVETACSILKRVGAIDDLDFATEYGQFLYPLPIDVELAHLVASMPSNYLKQAMVDLAAAMSVPAKLYSLDKKSDKHSSLQTDYPNLCDIALLIKLVRGELTDYINLDSSAFNEAKQFSSQLRAHFDLPPLEKSATWQIECLKEAIANALPNTVYIKKDNRRSSYGNGYQEVVIARDSYLEFEPEALLVLKTYSLAGRAIKDRKTLATVASPIKLSKIIELNLATKELTQVTLDNGDSPNLSGHYEYRYANKIIKKEDAVVDTECFASAIVTLIEQGKLCPNLYDMLRKEYESLSLYQQVNLTQWQFQPVKEHLEKILNDLEITSLDELNMFDYSDFSYQLLDEYSYTQFVEQYPLEVILPKQQLRVEYFLKAKRVVLHYVSGQKVEAPKKWELPNFNGAKIQYRKASKLVDIK